MRGTCGGSAASSDGRPASSIDIVGTCVKPKSVGGDEKEWGPMDGRDLDFDILIESRIGARRKPTMGSCDGGRGYFCCCCSGDGVRSLRPVMP